MSKLSSDGISRVVNVDVFEDLKFVDAVHERRGDRNVVFLHGDS